MMSTAQGLQTVADLGSAERWLAVLVTRRPNGEPGVALVNAGILPHPVTGERVLGFVARGMTAKLTNLRTTPRATLVFRSGWEWIAVSGAVELAGPDDELPGLPRGDLPRLLRDIYVAAGGVHPDMDEYDRVMATERRTACLLSPTHFTTNPPGTEHKEREEAE
jgi:hypothetical protein